MNPTIIFYKNGNKYYETYYNNFDQCHNEFGPAIIKYYENGNKSCEVYCNNGNFHNMNGPARIYYYENGNTKSIEYFLKGNPITVNSDEEFEKYIKLLNVS